MGDEAAAGKCNRVLIVEDHPMIRECLAVAISSEPDLTVCGEADTIERAKQLIEDLRPELVIVDLTLKESNGLDLVHDLHRRHPGIMVLVVSMHDERLHAERAIHAGARGYIEKQRASREVLKAIRTVLAGGVYLSEQMVGLVINTFSGARRGESGLPIDTLTDRELHVFQLLGGGCSTREIANQLRVDVRTVETYRARIKGKLSLKNSFALLQQAIRWVESGNLRTARACRRSSKPGFGDG